MPNPIALDQAIPPFSFEATHQLKANFENYQGSFVILYFYPKDNTPGCTSESKSFRDNFHFFQQLNCTIFGISRDSLKSHENFKQKLGLPFELISDPESELCERFGVLKSKSLFGKKFIGISRSTFLIDPKGILRREWRGVKVSGHVKEVLETLKEMVLSP